MSAYSVRFYAGNLAANTVTVVYQIPSAKVGVIRDIEVYMPVSGDSFNCQVTGPGFSGMVWYVTSSAPSYWAQWQGRTVLNAGDSIQLYATAANTEVCVSGYLLDA